MTTTTAVILIAVIIAAAFAAWYFLRRRRSEQLRTRFGPEYEHAVRQYGGQTQAEDALEARRQRIERFHIHPLTEPERERFDAAWHDVQARFVDDPPASIRDADRLVCDVMHARGYPMSEFEHRAEDISVDHPHVVNNYRTAHEIAQAQEAGQASTEDLRKALVCYRDLFDELLEAHAAGRREMKR
jgi:ABC-type nickel/cobalt efflux system permease component RcnA